MEKVKRLFWDIETSPNVGLFWKSGYRITIPPENVLVERAIICIAYKWEGQKTIHYLKWDDKQSDKKLCKEFIGPVARSRAAGT